MDSVTHFDAGVAVPEAVNLATNLAAELAAVLPGLEPADRLRRLVAALPGRIVFTTSFGLEDQVLTHLIAEAGLPIALATLDTGRLFPETHDVWARTEARYGLKVTPFYPEQGAVESLVTGQGINGFRDSVAARQACCGIRKVEPLRRALAGAAGWVTGLRADQSPARGETPFAAFDAGHGLVKVNPLLDRSRDALVSFTEWYDVPVNALHAQGFLSIGCAPCTRAVRPGEPERAGRWWWEEDTKKECGLHLGPDGRLVRGKLAEGVAA